MKIHHEDVNSTRRLKFITEMKIDHGDENSLLRLKYVTKMIIHPLDKNLSQIEKFLLLMTKIMNRYLSFR